MEVKIIWTPQALKGLNKTITYLEEEWSSNEIKQLEANIKSFIERIIEFPEAYPKTIKFKHTYKGMVDKNNYIVYRIKPKNRIIEIVNFRDAKQKPIY